MSGMETTLPEIVVTAPAIPPVAPTPGPTAEAAQWIRRVRLTLSSKDAAEDIDLSDFRLTFAVRQSDLQTPNSLDLMVYNLSEPTVAKIKKEFQTVTLQAGYGESFGTIFQGNVKQFRAGRESQTDTFLNVLAADGDQAYIQSVISVTLAAGASSEDALRAVLVALEPFGVTRGYIAPLPPLNLPRAHVLHGMVRDVLRGLSEFWGMTWSIQSGRLTILPLQGRGVPGPAIVINSATGMIGVPAQTLDGIEVRTLLNPRQVAGATVQIDNKSVQEGKYKLAYAAEPLNALLSQVRIAADGLYRVIAVDHTGDTRGQAWYSDLICVALGDPTTLAQGARGRL